MINELRNEGKESSIPRMMMKRDGKMTTTEEECMEEWKNHFERIGKMDSNSSRFEGWQEESVRNIVQHIAEEKMDEYKGYNEKMTKEEVRKAMPETPLVVEPYTRPPR